MRYIKCSEVNASEELVLIEYFANWNNSDHHQSNVLNLDRQQFSWRYRRRSERWDGKVCVPIWKSRHYFNLHCLLYGRNAQEWLSLLRQWIKVIWRRGSIWRRIPRMPSDVIGTFAPLAITSVLSFKNSTFGAVLPITFTCNFLLTIQLCFC